jgi:hypothetical protein
MRKRDPIDDLIDAHVWMSRKSQRSEATVRPSIAKVKPKNKRVFSGKCRYHKYDIATGQLETAIRLFLTDGCDMFSALSLAAAAGEILHGLVVNAGKEPFVDDIIKVNNALSPGKTPPRSAMIKHINKLLFVNELKHLDDRNEEFVDFDAEECALSLILKAINDYETFTGKRSQSMEAFLAWTYINLDSAQVMKSAPKA